MPDFHWTPARERHPWPFLTVDEAHEVAIKEQELLLASRLFLSESVSDASNMNALHERLAELGKFILQEEDELRRIACTMLSARQLRQYRERKTEESQNDLRRAELFKTRPRNFTPLNCEAPEKPMNWLERLERNNGLIIGSTDFRFKDNLERVFPDRPSNAPYEIGYTLLAPNERPDDPEIRQFMARDGLEFALLQDAFDAFAENQPGYSLRDKNEITIWHQPVNGRREVPIISLSSNYGSQLLTFINLGRVEALSETERKYLARKSIPKTEGVEIQT